MSKESETDLPIHLTDFLCGFAGFKKCDVPKIVAFAERQNLTVPQLIRVSMRRFQAEVEPIPDDMFCGCMGD